LKQERESSSTVDHQKRISSNDWCVTMSTLAKSLPITLAKSLPIYYEYTGKVIPYLF